MRNVWLHFINFISNVWTGARGLRRIGRPQFVHTIESFSKRDVYISLIASAALIISGGILLGQILGNHGHYGGELTEGLLGEPQFINPVLASSNSTDSDLSRIVFAQLLSYNAQGVLVPDLAEGLPELSADKKTYRLKLRPNLKWQDGTQLNADDVIWTIQTIQKSEYESPLRPNWLRVKVQRIDDTTIEFKLSEISNSFINNFAVGILPHHLWENLTPQNFRLSDQNLRAVGAGPFSVDSIKKTADGIIKSIRLKANPYYYQGRPFLNSVTFKFYPDYNTLVAAYQGREVESLGLVPFDKTAFLLPHAQTLAYQLNLPQYQAVFFNLARNAVLKNKAVRQALWLTTNRNQIIDEVYAGNVAPAFGPLLPQTLGFNPEVEKSVHYNLDEAASLLDKAGWALNPATSLRAKGKQALEFNLVTSGNLVLNVQTAQMLQEQWAKIGAKVNLIIVSPRELHDNYIKDRTFDAILTNENTGADPDPFPFWHTSQSHDPGLNLSGFSSTEADRLLTEARQTTDNNIRIRDYLRFQEIINGELPAIFLTRSLFLYNIPKNLQGISLSNIYYPSERFMNINQWYFGK